MSQSTKKTIFTWKGIGIYKIQYHKETKRQQTDEISKKTEILPKMEFVGRECKKMCSMYTSYWHHACSAAVDFWTLPQHSPFPLCHLHPKRKSQSNYWISPSEKIENNSLCWSSTKDCQKENCFCYCCCCCCCYCHLDFC